MKTNQPSRHYRLGLLLAIGLIAGCNATPVDQAPDTSHAIYYPPPPSPPRFQFLTSFSDGQIVTVKQSTTFSDWVVGSDTDSSDDSGRIGGPYGIEARNGRIYVCDVERDRVHVIDFQNHTYSTLGHSSLLNNPVNIMIDENNMKYVCDTGRSAVMVFDAEDKFVRELGDPQRCTPMDIVIIDDLMYVADIKDREIEVWTRSGQLVKTISQKGRGPEDLTDPTNLAVGPEGYLYVTDTRQQIIKIFDTEGRLMNTIGGRGSDIGYFARPKGIAVDKSNDAIYVTDSQWDVIQIFNSNAELLLVFGEPGIEPHSMGLPAGISLDATSIEAFRPYIAPDFEPEYLVFITNQFGHNKIAVYAFGRSKQLTSEDYKVDEAEIERVKEKRREKVKAKELEESEESTP